jgi:peptidoglycan/xylan/chitin deacetylase (PgdA/CDA1 family)
LFLDDDMICEADLVDQHAQMYREGADAAIGDTPTHPDSLPGFLSESVRRWLENEQVRSPLSHWDIFSGQLSVRRSAFDAVGGFDEQYTRGSAFANEDADLGVRLLSQFSVRYNPRAITRQKYVVTPREYMARAKKAVEADLHFLAKHPQFSRELLEARGLRQPLTRFVYIPLSRIPFLSKALSAAIVWVAETALRTPFRSNRLLARCFSGSRAVNYWTELRARRQTPGTERLLTLCFHAIRDQSSDPILSPYGVPPEIFAWQLDFLSGAGFSFVTPDEVANFLRFGAPLPRKAVLLTFDDGYEDLLQLARDVLYPRNIQAIAFAVTGIESATNEWDQIFGADRLALLTGPQLRELASLGIEIGSHSRTHREMPSLAESELRDEAGSSADDLVATGVARPRFFAYPFGSSDARTRRVTEESGYLAGFGCRTGYISSASDHFELPRVTIFAYDRTRRFRLKVSAPRLFQKFVTVQQAARTRFGNIRKSAGARQ